MMLVRLALLAILALAPAAMAQDAMRIAAIVNDEAISFRDLDARIHLVLVSTNVANTPENRRRAAPQVLRALIDERLQIQEGKRLNLDASETEINDAFRRIETDAKLPSGGIEAEIQQAGIHRPSFVDQIRASLVWQKLIRRQVAPQIQVGDDEVEEIYASILRTKDLPELRIAEIQLGIDRPDREGEVRRFAEQLIEQARGGADFAALARQFSEGATASSGGEIGWVLPNQIDDAIEREIAKAEPGSIVGPIRTVSGFSIMKLTERRLMQAPNADDVVVNLRQALFPVAGDENAARQKAAAMAQAKACPDFEKLAEEAGALRPYSLGRLKVSDLNAALKPMIAPIEAGKMSEPTRISDVVVVFMVCDKTEPAVAGVPKREEIREQLFRSKLSIVSRRYLRDLRRAAYLDFRT
ncbi:MAG: peptidylprolyl isomerase [Rhodospirillaceae bacterium]|nr:peptidylprolyl isomerase [Rhodospirillaceae bacterium]